MHGNTRLKLILRVGGSPAKVPNRGRGRRGVLLSGELSALEREDSMLIGWPNKYWYRVYIMMLGVQACIGRVNDK